MATAMDPAATLEARRGVIQGVAAYSLWGLLPLFLYLLHGVPSLQILAHRIVWSLVLLTAVALAWRRVGPIRAALAQGRTAQLLMASALLIAVNWLVYIFAVMNGHVLESSLGYFINPLVSVALGMVVLGERLGRQQIVAVAVAGAGVAGAALAEGGALWISLVLAFSFGGYGLVRKMTAIESLGGLLVETALLAPFALGWLLWTGAQGTGSFGSGMRLDLLLIAAGPVTAVPLLLFAGAARRLRLATLGLLQFVAPTLQFLLAILFFGEPLRPTMLAAFALIWIGCAIYALDGLRSARRPVAPIEL